MKNAKTQLQRAMQKTTTFMLKVEENSSDRIPDWYDQMALSAEHKDLTPGIYESLLKKLTNCLNKEYGSSATKYILS